MNSPEAVQEKEVTIGEIMRRPIPLTRTLDPARIRNLGQQTIYLRPPLEVDVSDELALVAGISYYSDEQLMQVYGENIVDKSRLRSMTEVGDNYSAAYYQRFMRLLTDNKQYRLGHLIATVSQEPGKISLLFGGNKITREKITPYN